MSVDILYKEQSYALMGACFEVYREKGSGFLESVYQECLEIEFELRELPCCAQTPIDLDYKGRKLKQRYIPDFLCYESIILEIKAIKELTDEHRAQVHNYLKATGHRLGILANFNSYPKLQYERIVR